MSGGPVIYGISNARATFTTRHGGCSTQPYDSLNIALHVEDNRGDVLRNRELVHKSLEQYGIGAPHSSWSFLNQTHHNNIVVIDSQTIIDNEEPPIADASVTQELDQPLVVMTADCGPVVIAGQSIVSVIHASWRTVVAGIIESTIEELKARAPKEKFYALLGPCIHPAHYEFEEELLSNVSARLGSHVVAKTHDDKPAFDLPGAVSYECTSRGVSFDDVNIDTFTSDDYFSYRRDGVTGRQGVIAWL